MQNVPTTVSWNFYYMECSGYTGGWHKKSEVCFFTPHGGINYRLLIKVNSYGINELINGGLVNRSVALIF